MAKSKYFGTALDDIYRTTQRRFGFKVYIWNGGRTTINDVALGRATSPRYDITDHVVSMAYSENISFENGDDMSVPQVTLDLVRNSNAQTVQINERTIRDSTPIQVVQGDNRVAVELWIPIFTGVIRGNSSSEQWVRKAEGVATMRVVAIGREEASARRVITGRSFLKDTDVGTAAVETAIEFMSLDRREVSIGFQNYPIKHPQSQVVDIEALKGIYEMLFPVGKKPKFDAEGILVAADADLEKPAARTYKDMEHFVSISRKLVGNQVNNSIRLLGLDDDLTAIIERVKRIAHGSITAGYFRDSVSQKVFFSESPGKELGGRKAKDTFMRGKVKGLGGIIGGEASWSPHIEDDGIAVFWGKIEFDTGYAPEVQAMLVGTYLSLALAAGALFIADQPTPAGILQTAADVVLVAVLLAMQSMGHLEWEVWGNPFEYVYQQLSATAQLDGILTQDTREKGPVRNDWLYDIDHMKLRAKELLKRELIKGHTYNIVMLEDPFLETDDIIEVATTELDPTATSGTLTLRFYITSIQRSMNRKGAPPGTMQLTAWRIQ